VSAQSKLWISIAAAAVRWHALPQRAIQPAAGRPGHGDTAHRLLTRAVIAAVEGALRTPAFGLGAVATPVFSDKCFVFGEAQLQSSVPQ